MASDVPANWVVLCEASQVEEGAGHRVEVDGFPPLAVFKLEDEFFVTDDTCTHGDASLCDGFVDGDQVECPWHSGTFCIKTGEAKNFPAVEPIKIYQTKLQDGKVTIAAAA
ncbi:MAG: non-heme iron oxygenase ferredoxin subunit [Janthinobacterium lividum]